MDISTSQYFIQAIDPNLPRIYFYEFTKTVTVNCWELHTIQKTLCLETVIEKQKSKGKKGSKILVVKYKGLLYIIDGHHAAAAKMNNGFRQLKVSIQFL